MFPFLPGLCVFVLRVLIIAGLAHVYTGWARQGPASPQHLHTQTLQPESNRLGEGGPASFEATKDLGFGLVPDSIYMQSLDVYM